MKSVVAVLSALALLGLGACAGFYAAGDAGASAPADSHRNLTNR
jgi:hypothetical protein